MSWRKYGRRKKNFWSKSTASFRGESGSHSFSRAIIKPSAERGNKPYDLELMLRIYMLENLYDLSDEGTVAEVIDSRAFSDFCRVDSSNQVPNGDSLGRFRNLLIRNGLQEKLFTQVVAMRMERGLRKQAAKFNIMFALANLILADRPCLAA